MDLIGHRGNAIRWKSTPNLVEDLDFIDEDELYIFIDESRFNTFFKQYADVFIYPEIARVKAIGGVRGRGVSLATVETRMIFIMGAESLHSANRSLAGYLRLNTTGELRDLAS